jgi:uncharacterized phage protein (TIGR01671 family)
MNREIKFRVWDLQYKHWICVEKFLGEGYGNINDEEDVVIQQFTGLKDGNGKDVYEGDIVKTIHDDNNGINQNYTGEVIYSEVLGSHKIKCGNLWLPIIIVKFDENELPSGILSVIDKVIGNIFENPDLIKS